MHFPQDEPVETQRTRRAYACARELAHACAVGDRVVFNIAGNKYRLVTYINYGFYTVYVRFVGTHNEYDEVDVENV